MIALYGVLSGVHGAAAAVGGWSAPHPQSCRRRGGAAGVRALLKQAEGIRIRGSLAKAAERFLRRQVELEDAFPFDAAPAARAEHAARMNEAHPPPTIEPHLTGGCSPSTRLSRNAIAAHVLLHRRLVLMP